MVNHNLDNLIQKRSGTVTISLSSAAFALLCVYLAMISLCYVDWVPLNLVSLSLYGFLLLSALVIFVRGKFIMEKHTVWYAAFSLLCAVSCLYSEYPLASRTMIFEMFKVLLFSLMFLNMINNEKRLQIAMTVITISIIILYLHLDSTGQLEAEGRLGQDLTGNANTFAAIFMIGAFCSVYFVYFAKNKSFKILALILFVLQLYAIALAGSRKFFLMPVALIGVLKIFSTGKSKRKFLFRNVIIAAAILFVTWWALFNVGFLYDAIGYRMEGMVAAITGEGEADASAEVRMEMIRKGIELWKTSPLVGHGIDTYKNLSGYYVYSHNNYTELLCNLGLVGVAVYYWFIPSLAWKLIKHKQMGMRRWYWAIALICLLIFDYGAVTYNMYLIHMVMLLANCALRIEKDSEWSAQKETVDHE